MPILRFAYDQQAIDKAKSLAKRTGKPRYVRATFQDWVIQATPPAPTVSHWKLDTDGSVWAHLAETPDYFYEPSQR